MVILTKRRLAWDGKRLTKIELFQSERKKLCEAIATLSKPFAQVFMRFIKQKLPKLKKDQKAGSNLNNQCIP